MNNPVFGEGIDALLAGASIPDLGEAPESKYSRKKKRRQASPVESAGVEIAETADDLPEVEGASRMTDVESMDNGLPPQGGQPEQPEQPEPVQQPLADVPLEWLRITLCAFVGRKGKQQPDVLSCGTVAAWSDPLQKAGNGWPLARLEIGIWRMARMVEGDQMTVRPVLEESTVLSVTGAPFGFGGAGTCQVEPSRTLVPPAWLDIAQYPVCLTALEKSQSKQSLRSIWPWFYLLTDEVSSPTRQVSKRLSGSSESVDLVPVLPVAILPRAAGDAEAVRLRSRLMDRVGYAALYVGFGDQMAPGMSPDVPLVVDLGFDQMPALDGWMQDVIDTTYSFDD